ncbi:MAG TPA: response regulator transcription factor [Nocardioidaceae bacterium]|nr:response regulator transcription factor [Nocardioidaceae bacterium]
MATILVVDDDPDTLRALEFALQTEHHRVLTASSGRAGLAVLASSAPDVVISDLNMPDQDGIALTRAIRRRSEIPVLILSGMGDEHRKVLALDSGADDFLQKPFGIAELKARLRALERRAGARSPGTLRFGSLEVDVDRSLLLRRGEEIPLTQTQWALVRLFVTNPGRLLTHRRLAAEIWGTQYGDEVRQTLRTHLRVLRAKLGDNATEPVYIRTESGSGYRWIAEAAEDTAPPPGGPRSPDPDPTRHALADALTVLATSCVELARSSDELLGLLPAGSRERDLAESIAQTVGRGRVAALRAEDLLSRWTSTEGQVPA